MDIETVEIFYYEDGIRKKLITDRKTLDIDTVKISTDLKEITGKFLERWSNYTKGLYKSQTPEESKVIFFNILFEFVSEKVYFNSEVKTLTKKLYQEFKNWYCHKFNLNPDDIPYSSHYFTKNFSEFFQIKIQRKDSNSNQFPGVGLL